MISTLASLQAAGVGFHATKEADGSRNLRVELFPAISKASETSKPTPVADLDKLEGPAYEAALAKMSDAERRKYLESA